MEIAQKRYCFSERRNQADGMELRGVRHVYSQGLDLRVGKLRVRRFSLNRHLPEKGWVETHAHRHGQFLLYLSGSGRQRVGRRVREVVAGSVFYFSPGCEHSFIEGEGRRPLCLALDVDLAGMDRAVEAVLSGTEVREVRQAVSQLHGWQAGEGEVSPREGGAVLVILDVLMRATGMVKEARRAVVPAVVRRAREAFQQVDGVGCAAVGEVAERVGYHRDHLARLLKRATGMTPGQLRDAERLKRVKRELRRGGAISAVADGCGFADPNYFSRWFKRQTGVSPMVWRGREAG